MVTGTYEEVLESLRKTAYSRLQSKVDSLGFSEDELTILSQDELQKKLKELNSILKNENKIKAIGTASFNIGKDFSFSKNEKSSTVGFTFQANRNLLDKKQFILDLIKSKSREEKISSLGDLIDNIADKDLRKKIEAELNDFKKQETKIEEQQKEIKDEKSDYQSTKQQLEISKTKLDLFEKKSQIWLAILAKESIASIVGALLLIVISICLMVAMFVGVEPTKIVESTFLLILGYFFGHAVSKK